MIYLVIGKQNIRLKSQTKSIVKKSIGEVDAMNYVEFDATLTLVQEIVDDANYIPLGYDRKAVVVSNCYFLLKNKGRQKIDSDQDFDALIDYINNPSEDCDLIFLVNISENDIDKKSVIYQAIEKHGKIGTIEEPTSKDWHQVVAKFFQSKWPDKEIDNNAIYELARRTDGDYASLFNNGNKLALYTDHIRFEDVVLLVTRPLEDNVFDIFNFLIDGHNIEAVALYRDLKVTGVEPVTLISMVANQFRTLNRVSYLAKKGYNADEIAKELGINPIQAKIQRKNSFVISSKRINQALEDLYQLDLQIKSGLVDRFYSFELFLINFNRN